MTTSKCGSDAIILDYILNKQFWLNIYSKVISENVSDGNWALSVECHRWIWLWLDTYLLHLVTILGKA